jgi:hypothetical protein
MLLQLVVDGLKARDPIYSVVAHDAAPAPYFFGIISPDDQP